MDMHIVRRYTIHPSSDTQVVFGEREKNGVLVGSLVDEQSGA
jgi:hypothetical protein